MDDRERHQRTLLARAIAVLTAWERTVDDGQSLSGAIVADYIDDDGTSISEQKALELIEGLVNLAGILLLHLEYAERGSPSSILQMLALKYSGDG